jgi:hypothetical protein
MQLCIRAGIWLSIEALMTFYLLRRCLTDMLSMAAEVSTAAAPPSALTYYFPHGL